MSLTKEKTEEAAETKEVWKRKAEYWHNAIPNFKDETRSSITDDVQTVFTYEQLELNKSLSSGVKWNNRINVTIGIINLILFTFNIILILRSYV